MAKKSGNQGLRYAQHRTFDGRRFYLLSATISKREANDSKERAKALGSLARIVKDEYEGKPAYLVYVFRKGGKNPEGHTKAERLNKR